MEDPVSAVRAVLEAELGGLKELDEDIFEYLSSMLADASPWDDDYMKESVAPFLLSSGFLEEEEDAESAAEKLAVALRASTGLEWVGGGGEPQEAPNAEHDRPALLEKMVKIRDADEGGTITQDMQYLWGTDKVRKMFNDTMDWDKHLSKKDQRRAAKEQEQFLKELEALTGGVDDDGEDDIAMMVLPEYDSGHNEKDIQVSGFNIDIAGKLLLEGADLKLSWGRKYGLIGKNGTGKTTLLRHMATYDIEGFPRHHRVLHVKQEIKASQRSVLEAVVTSDVERSQLLKREQEINDRAARRADGKELPGDPPAEEDAKELAGVYDRLIQIDAHSAEARAGAILHGLGFSDEQMAGTTAQLSGGWRMRVALAGALFIEPDVLLLDEPTNHLDLEAVLWLQDYLKGYPKTLLLVSHDRSFLNEVASDIILLHKLKLHYYKGNYTTFESVRTEQIKNLKRQFEAEKAKREHMQEFIDKFRYNAKRASLVQSRIKALDKMEEMEEIEEEIPFTFSLPEPSPIGAPILTVESVSFGYDASRSLLLEHVDFGIDMKSRIGIVGPNGCGKSTLLNLILDKLRPISGAVRRNSHLRIGTFTQHHAEQFDYRLGAVENMMHLFPGVQEQEMRSFLGQFRLSGPLALRPLKFLSGGQKSRVAFAALAWTRPHIVILDEPTNHLDMETIDALIGALKAFQGAAIVVSHDAHFVAEVTSELWVVGGGRCQRFSGTFEDYRLECTAAKRQQTASRS